MSENLILPLSAPELQRPDLVLLTNSQDIAAVLDHFGAAVKEAWGDCSGALVLARDGDYTEVWLSVWSQPWDMDARYCRILPAGGGA